MKLTKRRVQDFWLYMSKHYDTTILQKNSDLTKIIDVAKDFSLDALKNAGTEIHLIGLFLDKLGVMNVDKFLQDYATTLGERIYIPFEIGQEDHTSLKSQVRICVHEHQHVLQYREEPLSFVVRYLADRAQRAMFEAEAFRCNLEVEYTLTGKVPSVTGYAEGLKAYNCTAEDVMVVEKALRLSKQTIEAGGITTKAGIVACRWLSKNLED
jgi:hypothetical protein